MNDAVAGFALAFVPMVERLEKLPLPIFRRMREARTRLDRVIRRVIAKRRRGGGRFESPSTFTDLVSMLLAARDPGESPRGRHERRADSRRSDRRSSSPVTRPRPTRWRGRGTCSDRRPTPRHGCTPSSIRCSAAGFPPLKTFRGWNGRGPSCRNRCGSGRPPGRWGGGCCRRTRLAATRSKPRSLVIMSQWVVHRDPRWWDRPDAFTPSAGCARRCRTGAAAEVRVLPVWRRIAGLHRRIVRVDGSDSAAGHDRATLAVPPRARLDTGARAANHAPAERVRMRARREFQSQSSRVPVQGPEFRGL